MTRRRVKLSSAARRGGLVLLLGLGGCSPGPGAPAGCESSSCAADAPAGAEVGFIELGAATYEIGSRQLSLSPGRFFYSYQPARNSADTAPLLVLAAGGPGAASLYLLAGGLGPFAMGNEPGAAPDPSPQPLTDFANLLAIDARNTGFSYVWTGDPAREDERRRGFQPEDYNVYSDAADAVRALVSFLGERPSLSGCPIYWLAHSYGGLRAVVALHMMLFHRAYADGELTFHAAQVDEAVERFSEQRFGSPSAPPEAMARALRGQILVQPLIAGERQVTAAGALFDQPQSVVARLAADTGADFVPCAEQPEPCDPFDNAQALLRRIERSSYDVRRPESWERGLRESVDAAGTRRDTLARLVGVEPAVLDRVFAGRVSGAYRFADLTHSVLQPRGDLEQFWGSVEPWDTYFVSTNSDVMSAFVSEDAVALGADPGQTLFAPLLFDNLRITSVFITRAEFDMMLYSPGLLVALAGYPEVTRVADDVGGVDEAIEIELTDGTVRTLAAPRYSESGHFVYLDEPVKLSADVARFLRQSGP